MPAPAPRRRADDAVPAHRSRGGRRRSGPAGRLLALLLGAGAVAALAGCSGVGTLNALTPSQTVELQSGVAYGGHPRQRLDVYRPLRDAAGATAAADPPVVVFFYGGNWVDGRREDYRFAAEALASAGAVVVVPDYRLYPEVRYPAFVDDAARAVRWALARMAGPGRVTAPMPAAAADAALGGPASRLVLMGHSSGAYEAAMLALDPRWLGPERVRVAGWVGLAGPYDFLPVTNPTTQQVFAWPATPRDSQPIAHVAAGAPPALLLAAERDALVDPARNTRGLARALRGVGVPVQDEVFGGAASHALLVGALARPLRWVAPVRERVLDFIGLGSGAGGLR